MYIPLIGGCRPNPIDPSEAKFGSLRAAIEKGTYIDEYIIEDKSPLGDQGGLKSCVGNGGADALEMLLGLEGKEVIQLSRLFVYWNGRHKHGAERIDDGTYIRAACQAMMEHGVCRESDWEYKEDRVNDQPTIWAYENGSDNKVTGLYAVDNDASLIENLVTSIYADHPIIEGMSIGPEFRDYWHGDPNHVKVFDAPATTIGDHCVIVHGYRFRADGTVDFLLRNSWSADWGVNGKCWVSSRYLQSGLARDFTVVTRVPNIL